MKFTTVGLVTVWIVLGVITAWRVVAMIRTPSPSKGSVAVTLLFGTAFLANTLQRVFVRDALDHVQIGLALALRDIALMCFLSGFIYFFASRLDRPSSMASLPTQAGIVGAASLAMTVAWALTPPNERLILFGDYGAQTSQWAFVREAVSVLFFSYAFVAATVLAWSAGRGRPAGWRWGFRTCAVGMALCLIGGPLLRAPSLISRWVAHRPLSPVFESARGYIAVAGILAVLGGVFFVGARAAAKRSAGQVTTKQRYLALRPLWRLLQQTYPAIALHPPRHFLAELFTFGPGLRYRYGRRKVECRDGLWRLSPHVLDPDDSDAPLTIDQQARLVLDAVDRSHRGEEPVATAVAIAAPGDDDERPDADADQLVALSRAIRRHSPNRWSAIRQADVVEA